MTFSRDGDDVRVRVTLTNIRDEGLPAYYTFTIYDAAKVPVISNQGSITVNGGQATDPALDLDIPSWAFVGMGTVYVNVFDKAPQLTGVPYCPEASAAIQIEA
jgi:hypothetical protein